MMGEQRGNSATSVGREPANIPIRIRLFAIILRYRGRHPVALSYSLCGALIFQALFRNDTAVEKFSGTHVSI